MSLSLVGLLAAPALLVPSVAFAADDVSSGLSCGAQLDVGNVGTTNSCATIDAATQNNKLNDIVKLVINIFSLVVGIVAIIMIIVGGLKYITSSGDSGNVQSAKNTILYAIIGLVVVALAQFIVRFVLSKIGAQGTA